MKRIIELDEKDIKELISEKYGVNPKDIEWDFSETSSSYYQDECSVIFKFEEKNNDKD